MSNRILTCHTEEFTPGAGSEPFSIDGRCLLFYVWVIGGLSMANTGVDFRVDFKSRTNTGSILLTVPVVSTGYAQSSNRISCGTGGILFPDGIYTDPNAVSTDAVGGMTLLYELG